MWFIIFAQIFWWNFFIWFWGISKCCKNFKFENLNFNFSLITTPPQRPRRGSNNYNPTQKMVMSWNVDYFSVKSKKKGIPPWVTLTSPVIVSDIISDLKYRMYANEVVVKFNRRHRLMRFERLLIVSSEICSNIYRLLTFFMIVLHDIISNIWHASLADTVVKKKPKTKANSSFWSIRVMVRVRARVRVVTWHCDALPTNGIRCGDHM